MSRCALVVLGALGMTAVARPAIGQATATRSTVTVLRAAEPAWQEETSARQVPKGCHELAPGLYVYPPPSTPVNGDRVRPLPYYVFRAPAYYERSAHFTDRRRGGSRFTSPNRSRYDYRRRATRHNDRYHDHRYCDDRSYYEGYGDPYAAPTHGYRAYDRDLNNAYEQGRYDADNDYLWSIASARAGLLINQSRAKFKEAIIYFRDGKYDRAAINMLGAAEKNQADPASRLHAGHALFALGQYEEAVRLLARAFELSPSLAYKNYDIRDEYGNKEDFERHRLALRTYVESHPNDAAAVTLMGYVTFYTDGPGAAHPYLAKAAKLNPLSYFIPKLEKLARYAGKGEAGLELMPKRETPPQIRQSMPPAMSPVPPNNAPAQNSPPTPSREPQGITAQYDPMAV